MSSERRIEIEVEVPATPARAWEAIRGGRARRSQSLTQKSPCESDPVDS